MQEEELFFFFVEVIPDVVIFFAGFLGQAVLALACGA
jgi:hypothetical protein